MAMELAISKELNGRLLLCVKQSCEKNKLTSKGGKCMENNCCV